MSVPATTSTAAPATAPRRSVLFDMADRYGMEPAAFEATLRATVVPRDCSREQFAAFLLVAKEYDLNPILKEIYAFPARGGGIQPIVSIDGWLNLINSHPKMDGLEFDDHLDTAGALTAVTARIWRKDRSKPIVVTEYMDECRRDTDTWNKWPRRMLRHKAAIQAGRYAFGFSGIQDPDEAERAADVSSLREIRPEGAPRGLANRLDALAAGPVIEAEPEEISPTEAADGITDDAGAAPAGSATAAPAAAPDFDPDEWLADVKARFAAAQTPDEVSAIWPEHVAPYADELLPTDMDDAGRLRDDAMQRVSGT